MNKSRVRSVIAAFALAAGAVAVAAPAYADNIGSMPSGCSMSPVNPSIASGSQVRFGGGGQCGSATVAYRLVHNYNGLPDVKVKEYTVQAGGYYTFTTCDNGGTTQYYSELTFYGLSTTVQRVSGTVTLSHC